MIRSRNILKRKNIAAIWLLSLFLLLSISGCRSAGEAESSTETAGADTLQIGLSFDSFVIERWLRDRDVFVSTAESLGAEVNVQNANGDVEEQIDQIRYLIRKGVDVIAIVAIDGDALSDVVQEAKEAGIKIICYDRLIKNAGTDLYISFDNEQVGYLMGEHLARELAGQGQIFAIYGSRSDNNVSQVQEGLLRALEDTNISIAYSAYCDNWLAELAFDAVNEGLQSCPDVDGIMCGNDDLAGQAIRALAEHRKAGTIPVAAQDAELSACQRILEGTQTMTVYKSVEEQAGCAARLAVMLGRGEKITGAPDPGEEMTEASSDGEQPLRVTETIFDGTAQVPYYVITPVAVTADNLDEVIIDSGFHRREDVYLNVNASENITGDEHE